MCQCDDCTVAEMGLTVHVLPNPGYSGASPHVASPDHRLKQISEDLRQILPLEAVHTSEVIYFPTVGEVCWVCTKMLHYLC